MLGSIYFLIFAYRLLPNIDFSEHKNSQFFRPTSREHTYLQIELCMKMRTQYIALVLFVCTLASCSKESGETTNIIEAENAVEVEQELLNTVNDHRVALGFNSLEFSAIAYQHANAHTDYMIAKGSINHDNFSTRASDISSKKNAEFVAENVAKDYNTGQQAFEGWLNSSSHKKTMEGEFTHTAVSVKKDANGNFYFTQMFFR